MRERHGETLGGELVKEKKGETLEDDLVKEKKKESVKRKGVDGKKKKKLCGVTVNCYRNSQRLNPCRYIVHFLRRKTTGR